MGYEILRFVSYVNESLICQICRKVYEMPKMLSSCEHVFCLNCIEKYVINGKNCPIDQKPIDCSHIEEAPKSIIEDLSTLKIQCEFYENGCREVISLNRLLLHRLNCQFHPKRRVVCDNCGHEADRVELDDHNCINVLRAKIDRLSQQIEEIKVSHKKEIFNLKSRLQMRDNFHNFVEQEFGKEVVDRKMVCFSCVGDSFSGTFEIIFIQTMNYTLQCETSPMTKVEQIKYNAAIIARLNTTEFSLYFNGTRLEDNKNILQYDIRKGTICHLLPNQIYITFDCVDIRQIIGFSVNTCDTIKQIMKQLNNEIQKLIPQQLFLYLQQCTCSLFFNNIKLEESYGLSNYDVFAIKILRYCCN